MSRILINFFNYCSDVLKEDKKENNFIKIILKENLTDYNIKLIEGRTQSASERLKGVYQRQQKAHVKVLAHRINALKNIEKTTNLYDKSKDPRIAKVEEYTRKRLAMIDKAAESTKKTLRDRVSSLEKGVANKLAKKGESVAKTKPIEKVAAKASRLGKKGKIGLAAAGALLGYSMLSSTD